MTRSHRPARATARVPIPGNGGAGNAQSDGRHAADPYASWSGGRSSEPADPNAGRHSARDHESGFRDSGYGDGGHGHGDRGYGHSGHGSGGRPDSGYGDGGYGRHGSGDDSDGFFSDLQDDRTAVGRAVVRPGGPGGPPRRPGSRPGGRAAQRDRGKIAKKRRRNRRIIAASAAGLMLLGIAVIAGTFAFVRVDLPDDLPRPQSSVVLANDSKTVIAREGDENRQLVKIDKIPLEVQHAVVSAEDRSFYKNSGIDIKGILRAAWNNVTDDDTQGASTITQQYARNVFNLNRDQSYGRKTKEAIFAMKLSQKYSKDQIMEFYLNTIYFGRNAYGIQAASQAYFGTDSDKLTVEQGAVLAAVIKSPHGYDPEKNPGEAKARWKWVLQGMTEMGFPEANGKAKDELYPAVRPRAAKDPTASKALSQIMKYVYEELKPLGITEQDLAEKGYRIRTSIDPMLQAAAEKAVTEGLKGQKVNLTSALVAVEPKSGRVLAYYGGPESVNGGWDQAGYNGAKRSGGHPPGSSFKPYVLAVALDNGASLKSVWDGSNGRTFEKRESPLNNPGHVSCERCNLIDATTKSLNTTFYALTEKYGKEKVIELARNSGVRYLRTDKGTQIDLTLDGGVDKAARSLGNEVGIGQYGTSVLEQASGIATFANKGMHVKTHFVLDVLQGDNSVYSTAKSKPKTTRAFSEDVAADATFALQQVIRNGKNDLKGGRQSAGKTGTWQLGNTDDNAHAWTVGYTPQLASAVWVGNKGKEQAIEDKRGRKIYGSGLPGQIWKRFMDLAHEERFKKKVKFPEPVYQGNDDEGDAPPEPEPTLTPSPGESDDPNDPDDPGPDDPRPTDTPFPTDRPTRRD